MEQEPGTRPKKVQARSIRGGTSGTREKLVFITSFHLKTIKSLALTRDFNLNGTSGTKGTIVIRNGYGLVEI